jgi:ribosomal protein L36
MRGRKRVKDAVIRRKERLIVVNSPDSEGPYI